MKKTLASLLKSNRNSSAEADLLGELKSQTEILTNISESIVKLTDILVPKQSRKIVESKSRDENLLANLQQEQALVGESQSSISPSNIEKQSAGGVLGKVHAGFNLLDRIVDAWKTAGQKSVKQKDLPDNVVSLNKAILFEVRLIRKLLSSDNSNKISIKDTTPGSKPSTTVAPVTSTPGSNDIQESTNQNISSPSTENTDISIYNLPQTNTKKDLPTKTTPSKGKKVLNFLGGKIGKLALGGIGGGLISGVGAYKDYKDIEEAQAKGEITPEQASELKSSAVGGGVGGTIGGIAGGVLGSVLGPVGTIAGAAAGNWLGEKAGRLIGGTGNEIYNNITNTSNISPSSTINKTAENYQSIIKGANILNRGDQIDLMSKENATLNRQQEIQTSAPIISNNMMNNTQSIVPIKAQPRTDSSFSKYLERTTSYS